MLPSVALVLVTGTVLALLLAHTTLLLQRAHAKRLANVARTLALCLTGLTPTACVYILWLVPYFWGLAGTRTRAIVVGCCLIIVAAITFVYLRTERVLRESAEQTCPRMPRVDV